MVEHSAPHDELAFSIDGRPVLLGGSIGTRANVRLEYNNIVSAQFLERLVADSLAFVRGDGWRTAADRTAIPGEVILRVHYSRIHRYEVLTRLDGAVVHVALKERQLDLKIAARDEAAGVAALSALEEALPRDVGDDDETSVSFWWWDRGSPEQLGRRLGAPTWAAIQGNYASETTESLDAVMSWTAPPTTGGRLILWHGAPGTGKTTAVRALAREWSSWADFQFITDPELSWTSPATC